MVGFLCGYSRVGKENFGCIIYVIEGGEGENISPYLKNSYI